MSLSTILQWPSRLRPASIQPNPVPFTRSGGHSLNGLSRNTKTDRGYWMISYTGIPLKNQLDRRIWNGIRVRLNGKSGLLSIPVWSFDLQDVDPASLLGAFQTTFDDLATFSDGSLFSQPTGPYISMQSAAAIGDTIVTLQVDDDTDDLAGMRFSYNHALYEIGLPLSINGDLWQVPIFPAIRAPIPAGAGLLFSVPRCLVRLADDRAMDQSVNYNNFDLVNVGFIEATDYWNDLALESA